MASDFVSVIQPTTAKSGEGSVPRRRERGLFLYCLCGIPYCFLMRCCL